MPKETKYDIAPERLTYPVYVPLRLDVGTVARVDDLAKMKHSTRSAILRAIVLRFFTDKDRAERAGK